MQRNKLIDGRIIEGDLSQPCDHHHGKKSDQHCHSTTKNNPNLGAKKLKYILPDEAAEAANQNGVY